ncbi:hypothetical protein [Thomasclavelia cocleata]|uniref:hypothetical protein n=1 Tax=Thomasclavelia cocleata TaxID=69824 RepID=UPI00242CA794|nr:hypothetical protein [Thomasclavelia cocleata]
MAHDFTIRVPNGIWSKRYDVITIGNEHTYIEKEEYKGVPRDEVYFFGYADGIFYKAFGCEECNNLFSGDGSIHFILHDIAVKNLKTAIEEFDRLKYPDPSRINDIKEFYERMKKDYKNVEYFEIIFS